MGFNSGLKGLTEKGLNYAVICVFGRNFEIHVDFNFKGSNQYSKLKCTLVQALRLCTGRRSVGGVEV